MAKIVPFRGLRYNSAKIDRMENVVTPPYDVIDSKAQTSLLSKNPYNMIQLDLTKQAGDQLSTERYEGAKKIFNSWQDENILLRDPEKTIYLYRIDYTLPNGRSLNRKGFVALVGLAEFNEGIVKPHEKTFRGVTDDRLRLIDTCQAQFSQIFSLYPDEKGEIMAALEKVCPKDPLYSVEDQDGCVHSLWPVTDEKVLTFVQKAFRSKNLYIADGHHRYTTALQLRELMAKRQGKVSEDSPYNHIMMYLCPMEDPGLSVLPTHRLAHLPGKLDLAGLIDRMKEYFVLEEIGGGSREILIEQTLEKMEDRKQDQTVFGMYDPDSDRCFLLTLKAGVMGEIIGPDVPAALLELDVVVLSDLIIDRLLGLSHEKAHNEELVTYFSDPDDALDAAVKESADLNSGKSPLLFLMNHTPVAQVKKIADENLIMPHKSTYFYPKILTGLLINKLVADEQIF